MKDDPNAIVDYMEPTVYDFEGVRDDKAPTNVLTGQTRSWANRPAKLYARARRLHQAQEWQAVVDVFNQIHALNPEYPDGAGLLASAREALAAPEPTEQTLSWTNRVSELYAQAHRLLTGQPLSLEDRLADLHAQARRSHQAQEWQAVLDVFDQIHALDPEYPDPERLLVSAREALAAPKPSITASNADRIQLLLTIEREESNSWVSKLLLGSLKKEGHTDSVRSVTFSPDGRLLASASGSGDYYGDDDNTLRLWRVEDGALLRAFEHSSPVFSVMFSPDGRLLASGSRDGTVRLWRVEDGALLRAFEGHTYFKGHPFYERRTNEVSSVAFSPDGRLIVSGSPHDERVRLWRVEDGALLHTLESLYSVRSIAFSLDGRLLASGSQETVQLWQVEDGAFLHALGLERYLGQDRLDTDVQYGVHNEPIPKIKGQNRMLDLAKDTAFSPDGRLLASATDDQMVRLWQVEDGALLHTLDGYSHSVLSVAFSPDGRLLALGSVDSTVRLWGVEDGTWLCTLEGHKRSVASVAFSPDGWLLASGSYDKTVRLWGMA